jgi:NitT/TauT family transport system permease protein
MANVVRIEDDAAQATDSSAGEQAASAGRRAWLFFRQHYTRTLSVVSVLVFLGAWQWASDTNVINPLFCSSPSLIWRELGSLISTGQLWPNVWISGEEFLWGFGIAIAVAIPLGFLIGWYKPVGAIFSPFVTFLNAVPRVALLPLLIIWVGIGIDLKIAVVLLGALIAILINVITGVQSLDQQTITMARSFGASDFKIFRTVALPGSVPYIISGLRVGLGHALTGVVVGELYASSAGVGHLISVAGNTFETNLVFAGVVIIALFGLIANWILSLLENRFRGWRQTAR